MDQVTAPVGCVAPLTPVTVVVNVVVPPKTGEEDEAKVIVQRHKQSVSIGSQPHDFNSLVSQFVAQRIRNIPLCCELRRDTLLLAHSGALQART